MSERLQPTVGAVIRALRDHRFAFANEAEFQEGIAAALTAEDVEFEREAVLTNEERVDFLVGSIAVEVKIAGSPSEVLRQISRYLRVESITAALLVTSRMKMSSAMPKELHDKPIYTYFVGGDF